MTTNVRFTKRDSVFKRFIKPILEKALKRSPVVLLNGARQVGKTTLTYEILNENGYSYITFDDEITYLAAKSDPSGFITGFEKPIIIDEVQRIPEIFLAIKRDVDKNRKAGRYLLTGSANPLLIPTLGDSLAGRMEIIDLFPLSQSEMKGVDKNFIDIIFSNQNILGINKPLTKYDLYGNILIGEYPSVQNLNNEDREIWMRNYLNLILQRDIKNLAQIEKVTELPNLLRILASRASNLINVADIARDSKLTTKTLHRYIVLLETIFLIYMLPSWSSNLTLRFTKSPKVYLIDSGLLGYLLDLNRDKILDNVHVGKVLENFIVSELKKQAAWAQKYVQLYHFRTSSGEEIDIILEDRSGNIIGIEIKNSSKVSSDDFKSLKYLKNKAPDKFIKGIVLYTGSQSVPFGEDLFAIPVSELW